MSIINQTLRALDARDKPAQPQGALPLRPVAAAGRRRAVWGVAGVGLLLAAVAGAWWATRPQTTEIAAPPAPAPAPAPAPVAVAAAPAPRAADDLPETTVAPALPTIPAPQVASPAPQLASPAPQVAAPTVPAAVAPSPGVAVERGKPPAPVPAASAPSIQKHDIPLSPEAAAEASYRKAVALLQKDRAPQAQPLLEEALVLHPGHVAARQTLVAVLVESGRLADAEGVLRTGRQVSPDHAWFALSLAKLQTARGDPAAAAATLQAGLGARGVDADYHALLAAVLVQLDRHGDAARHYRAALAQRPGEARWWVGLGMALAAQGNAQEARAAYRRALESGTLPDSLASFVHAALQAP